MSRARLRVGSLFSGIGGLDRGLELGCGARPAWFCESDPHARATLRAEYPGVLIYEDIRELRGAEVAPVDILAGGFPCQDISNAGKRAGISGARSGLWWEMLRLVRELGPRYVVVENVAALAQRGLDRVLGGLAELGYDAEWASLRADTHVGAPQRRRRLFVLAFPAEETVGDAGRERVQRRGVPGVLAPASATSDRRGHASAGTPPPDPSARMGREERDDASGGVGHARETLWHEWPPGPEDAEGWREYLERHPGLEPVVRRGPHGIPARRDRLRLLGNAVVPQVAAIVGRRIAELEGGW